jgi:Pregnancy-associated plasma protein-A
MFLNHIYLNSKFRIMNKHYLVKRCICLGCVFMIAFVSCQKDDSNFTDEPALAAENPTGRQCAAHTYNEALMAADPQFRQSQQAIEEFTTRFVAQYPQTISTRAVKTIGVIVHVVYNTAAENISFAQIQSQISILNKDFRKLNSDISLTPTIFKGVAADCEVNFVLSQVIRKSTTKTSFSSNNAVKKTSTGGSDAVTPSTKLNIWVCNLGTSLLGYAQFPGGSASTDGIVVHHKAFGNIGTLYAAYNKGRTATHEVGHWLNLRHIWGDGTCGSDLVSDTPTHNTANYGCPAAGHKSTCVGTPVEMTMNYMDYTDDACMYLFSAGQKARLQATLATGGSRAAYIQ